ncbi:MAG TPA: BrnT family toxin [Rhizomicrobium sp.]
MLQCGLPFGVAVRLFEARWLEWEDRRHDYGETHISTLGEIEGRVFFASFTRHGKALRIISFRKANAREIRRYRAALRNDRLVNS